MCCTMIAEMVPLRRACVGGRPSKRGSKRDSLVIGEDELVSMPTRRKTAAAKVAAAAVEPTIKAVVQETQRESYVACCHAARQLQTENHVAKRIFQPGATTGIRL